MIIVKYPNGKAERRTYALVSGEPPIGSTRPIPDGATLELSSGCITITEEGNECPATIWPWHMIKGLDLGPKVSETVILREGKPQQL